MHQPSKEDIRLLRRVFKRISEHKAITKSSYEALIASKSLPKYIINNIKWYYKVFKTGGTYYCTEIWPSANEHYTIPEMSTQLGEGGNGGVFLNSDGTATKVFNKPDKYIYDYLVQRLLKIFNFLNSKRYNIYTTLFYFGSPKNLAYTMKKLIPIPVKKMPLSEKVYKLLLPIFFTHISNLHSINIIHLDMKVDNVMFSPLNSDPNYENSLGILLNTLRTNMMFIDFDGCLIVNDYIDNYSNIFNEIYNRFLYHPTTPHFAHPFLLEMLNMLVPYDNNSRWKVVEHNSLLQRGIDDSKNPDPNLLTLNHEEYHRRIFKLQEHEDIANSYNSIFPNPQNLINININKRQLIKCLKFCDYYNMAMSLLYTKMHKVNNSSKKGEERELELKEFQNITVITCNMLYDKALELELPKPGINNNIQPQQSGGRPDNNDEESKREEFNKKFLEQKSRLKAGQYLEIDIGGQIYIHNDAKDVTKEEQYNESTLRDYEYK